MTLLLCLSQAYLQYREKNNWCSKYKPTSTRLILVWQSGDVLQTGGTRMREVLDRMPQKIKDKQQAEESTTKISPGLELAGLLLATETCSQLREERENYAKLWIVYPTFKQRNSWLCLATNTAQTSRQWQWCQQRQGHGDVMTGDQCFH